MNSMVPMSSINFFLQIFALMAGIPIIILVILIYKRYRKTAILFFGLLLLGILSFIMNSVILEYIILLKLETRPLFLKLINIFFANLGSVTFYPGGLLFIHTLFNLKKRWIAFLALLLSVGSILSDYFLPKLDLYIYWSSVILVTAYAIVILVWKYSSIIKNLFRRTVQVAIILLSFNILFLVLPLFDIGILYEISQMGISLFYLTLNVLALLFCLRYYSSLANVPDESIPDTFIARYAITPREAEIIRLLLAGHSARQLAETLFISPKTVSNHTHNIYRKTDVNTRFQLINLIKKSR